jgi:hypothetical protein
MSSKDFSEGPVIRQVYKDAVAKFIASLYESDFRNACGWLALKELEDYSLDIALDIQTVVEEL